MEIEVCLRLLQGLAPNYPFEDPTGPLAYAVLISMGSWVPCLVFTKTIGKVNNVSSHTHNYFSLPVPLGGLGGHLTSL
jgi:hypothetical protein